MCQKVELRDVLDARERRSVRQAEMIRARGLPVISCTMNIAGPVKNSPLIRRGFQIGRRRLEELLRSAGAEPAVWEETDAPTGCEALCAVNLPPEKLKKIACAVEDGEEPGRLLDLDVLAPDGKKLERTVPRRCLICDRPARECARNRTHSVEELQAATRAVLERAVNREDARTAARLAVRALLYEVAVTPKPGLVDRNNKGSHTDMDFFSFMASASALEPYFETCAETGRRTAGQEAEATMAALRWAGMAAEGEMYRATGGVNTHKGAVYSMGLLCGALGRLERADWADPEKVLREVAALAQGSVERELAGETRDTTRTGGERLYREYGVAGVRGEAEAGFPAVLRFGLPVLEEGLRQGKSFDEAGTAALMALMAKTEDTNMMTRGGVEKAGEIREEISRITAEHPFPDRETLEELDRRFIRDRLSPGGSADQLALCLMLHFLKEEQPV